MISQQKKSCRCRQDYSLRSDNALIEEAYSEGVIPDIFLNCLEK